MPPATYVNTLLFGIYPYVCLAVLLIGSLIRFDREPYTWKSDSSQMLRSGSATARIEPLPLRRDHRDPRAFRRFLAPDWTVDWALSPVGHQLLAMAVGGIAGFVAIVGLTILIARRLDDPVILTAQPRTGTT